MTSPSRPARRRALFLVVSDVAGRTWLHEAWKES